MATVAVVGGVQIRFYWNEHPPPHFHAVLAEHVAVIDIRHLRTIYGSLPTAKLSAVVEWAEVRKAALLAAWTAASNKQKPGKIA